MAARLVLPSRVRLKLLVIFTCVWGVVCLYVFGSSRTRSVQLQVAINKDIPMTSYQGKLKRVPDFGSDILLYSAVVGNSSNNAVWDKIALQGWQAVWLVNEMVSCCVRHRSGLVKQYTKTVRYGTNMPNVSLAAFQYICYLEGSYEHDPPELVTLAQGKGTSVCHADPNRYMRTSMAYRHPGEIAIFSKIVFGNVSANALLSWFEVHKLFGFSKVYLYPSGLNENAMKVLQHYQNEEKVQLIPFAVPGPEHGKRLVKIGTKDADGWDHKCVTLFDGLHRLRGYDYIATFDIDEYLIPKRNQSFHALFDETFANHDTAAGATLYSYLYLKDWGPTSNTSTFDIARYQNRSELTHDRVKHVIRPTMVEDGGFSAHAFSPLPGMVSIAMEEAALHHYRSCRPDNSSRYPCYRISRYYDDSVYKHFTKVDQAILQLKKQLGV